MQRENSILNGILNYRWRHLLKADVNTGYGKWTAGFVYRYYSYLDRIDDVFEIDVYPYTAAFGRYRDNRQYKGEHILDLKPDSTSMIKQRFPLLHRMYLIVL